MAKRKRSSNRRQPQHKNNLKKSQHDKRRRLERRNPNRKKTSQAKVPLSGAMHKVALMMRAVLNKRMAFRLSIIIAGMLSNRRMIVAPLRRGFLRRGCSKIGIGFILSTVNFWFNDKCCVRGLFRLVLAIWTSELAQQVGIGGG